MPKLEEEEQGIEGAVNTPVSAEKGDEQRVLPVDEEDPCNADAQCVSSSDVHSHNQADLEDGRGINTNTNNKQGWRLVSERNRRLASSLHLNLDKRDCGGGEE